MDKKGVKKMADILSVAYPSVVKTMGKDDLRDMMTLMYDALSEYPEQIVAVATKNYIRTNKYPPKDCGICIAGICEQIGLLTEKDNELWTALYKAIKNSLYNSAEEFEKLPQECKEFVGSAGALRDLAATDASVINTVTRGQFNKQIKVIRERKKAVEAIPAELRPMLGMEG